MSTYSRERAEYAPLDTGRWRSEFAHRRSGGPGPGLLLTGLAVVALGALGWYYLWPDLQRYLKIKSM